MAAGEATIRCSVLCALPQTAQVLGAQAPANGNLVPVSLAGDGVTFYDSSTQTLEASYPLGGAGRIALVAPAAYDSKRQVCTALVSEAATGEHRLVSWPAGDRQHRQQPLKPGVTRFTSIADVPQSVPIPSPASSAYILYPPHQAANGSFTAVVLQDGTVAYCIGDAVQLQAISTPATQGDGPTPPLRASCALSNAVLTLHQASAGQQAVLNEYSFDKQGTGLKPGRGTTVPCPQPTAQAGALQATSAYALVTWSDGSVTVIPRLRGGAPVAAVSSAPVHVPAPADAGAAGPAPASTEPAATSPLPGSKRKASSQPSQAADTDSSRAIIAAPIDSTQFIRLCVRKNGAHKRGVEYSIINAQYGCTVSAGTVDLDNEPQLAAAVAGLAGSRAGDGSRLRLYSHNTQPGQLLLQVGNAVAVLQVQTRPANLLSLVGKLGSSAAAATPAAAAAAPSDLAVDVRALSYALQAGTITEQPASEAASTLPVAVDVTSAALPDAAKRLAAALLAASQSDQPAPAQLVTEAVELIEGYSQKRDAAGRGASWALFAQLVPLAASAAAAARLWEQLGRLLRALPQQSLAGCEGLLLSVASAGQYQLLPQLCVILADVSASALIDTLAVLLTPAAANREHRLAYYTALRQGAEQAVAQAEAEVRQCAPSEGQPRGPAADAADHARQSAMALAQYAAATVDTFTPAQVLLHAPLAMSQDAATLPSTLRRLTNRQVDRLLAYLSLWLDKYTQSIGLTAALANRPIDPLLLAPTYSQVTEWVRMLIDAHLPRLLMTKTPSASLVKILELTKKQVKTCQQLMPLAGVIEHVRAAAPLPTAPTAASVYTVQCIKLGI